jgi:molybdate transport system permease protein
VTQQGHPRDEVPRPVGQPLHALSVISLGFVVLFVAMILMLLAADIVYLVQRHHESPEGVDVWAILTSEAVLSGIRLSLLTSSITLLLVMMFAVPIGYALSRYRFRGHAILNTVVDVPIVLPPVVIGVSLLALFGTPVGGWIRDGLRGAGWRVDSALGIVLCQFLVSVSYCIRATKASFDAVDRRLEHVALTLGCSRWGAFWRVTLPLARSGLIAGGVMAWARAIGVFGPLMVLVGTAPRVVVMPTAIWLELSTGDVEVSLVIALVAVTMAGAALALVHWLVPGRKWT